MNVGNVGPSSATFVKGEEGCQAQETRQQNFRLAGAPPPPPGHIYHPGPSGLAGGSNDHPIINGSVAIFDGS